MLLRTNRTTALVARLVVRPQRCAVSTVAKRRPARWVSIGVAGLGLAGVMAAGSTLLCDSPSEELVFKSHHPTKIQQRAGKAPPVESSLQSKGDDSYISMEEVARHFIATDAWVVVDGQVIDVTQFLPHHPGGSQIILANAGTDVTQLFKSLHAPGTLENNLPQECFKGAVDPVEAAKVANAIEAETTRIKLAREALPDVDAILGLDEMQAVAESFLSPRVVDYYGASSLDGVTLAENRNAYRKCRLVPRVLRNVASVSPQTTIFGVPCALPIYISPASNALLGHPDGELNLTRGAAKTGIVQGISAAASFPLGEILDEKDRMNEELGTRMGMVYQVYVQKDRERTKEAVKEAINGGVQALLLTVDTAVLGIRQSTDKMGGKRGESEPGIRMGPHTDWPDYHDPRLDWDDLSWLKEMAGEIPVYLKGVCHIEDVRLARDNHLAGVILSNHGGRQLDQARTGFQSLQAIHAEDPQLLKDIEVYVDGGVRRGTDVLQALAYGAKGVGLGRPFLWAQAAYGEQGVIRAIRIMEKEILLGMRLLGVSSLDELDSRAVECLQQIWK